MAGEVRPIRTKRDYEAALKEVERLSGAKAGTRDGDRIPHGAARAHPVGPGGDHWHAHPHRGGSEQKTRTVDGDDPAITRAPRHLGRSADPAESKKRGMSR